MVVIAVIPEDAAAIRKIEQRIANTAIFAKRKTVGSLLLFWVVALWLALPVSMAWDGLLPTHASLNVGRYVVFLLVFGGSLAFAEWQDSAAAEKERPGR